MKANPHWPVARYRRGCSRPGEYDAPAMKPPHDWAIMPRPIHRNIVPGIHPASSGQRGDTRRSYTGEKSTMMGARGPPGR